MGKRVLVIESDNELKEYLKRLLIKNGFEIAGEAGDGESAINLYARSNPDLIIMDLVMPVLGGIEAAKKIISRDPQATIIISSSPTDRYLIKEAMDAGVSGIIKEPFEEKKIIDVLDKIMHMKELQLGNRKIDRLESPLLIKYTKLPRKKFFSKWDETAAVNISLLGILFESREIIPVGTDLEMALEFPPGDTKVNVTGKVARVEEMPTTRMQEIAVRWTGLGDDVKNKIGKFLSSQERRVK